MDKSAIYHQNKTSIKDYCFVASDERYVVEKNTHTNIIYT